MSIFVSGFLSQTLYFGILGFHGFFRCFNFSRSCFVLALIFANLPRFLFSGTRENDFRAATSYTTQCANVPRNSQNSSIQSLRSLSSGPSSSELRPNSHRRRMRNTSKWDLLLFTLLASNIKGKTFQFACASHCASCVN